MSVADIEAALPGLTTEELSRVERAVHRLVTERELIASADEAFQAYDNAEAEDAKSRTR